MTLHLTAAIFGLCLLAYTTRRNVSDDTRDEHGEHLGIGATFLHNGASA